ncbi:hypothetical protein PVAND_010156 [Polypedilum vanderplanki]|uniref:EB domain-containing protein n=1 Tax=Polypedilum vanderplanki TaxID=319348 RepID=A0A9J6CGD4_POLVA|nr:hypothetical protein PVAND_010156 [Polypedilum vanderplanki]
MELSCESDYDCDTFSNMNISVKCFNHCTCYFKENGTEVNCIPTNLKKPNEIPNCPCGVNTECKNEKCVCKNGFIKFKSTDKFSCIAKIVQIKKSCDLNEQCMRFDKNSACINDICQCKENFIHIEGDGCRSLAKNENACNEHSCGINQKCIKGSCVCNQNYIFQPNKTECIAYAMYNETCFDEIQCELGIGHGTKCVNNTCTCDENHTYALIDGKSVCQRHVNYKQECKKDTDCASYFDDPTMICEENKCVCNDEQLNGESVCMLFDNKSSSSNIIKTSFLSIIFALLLSFCYR